MIFEVLTERSDGTPFNVDGVIIRPIDYDDAYKMDRMLEKAGLHKNVFICCAGGYENALFFQRD